MSGGSLRFSALAHGCFSGMDRRHAVAMLPEAYAEALRLDEAGCADLIPGRLGVSREAVGPLLRLARAKLDTLLAMDPLVRRPADVELARWTETSSEALPPADRRPSTAVGGEDEEAAM